MRISVLSAAHATIGPVALVTASWIVYLLVFPYEELLGGPILDWLLLLDAAAGLVVGVTAVMQNSRWSKLLSALLILILLVLYGVHWANTILYLSPTMKIGFGELVLYIARVKAKVAGELFSRGSTWQGIEKAYWDIMPLLQSALLLYWTVYVQMKRRERN